VLPWHKHPLMARGPWVVTWWFVQVNGRGSKALTPTSRAFPTEAHAREAAAERGPARKVTLRYERGAEETLD